MLHVTVFANILQNNLMLNLYSFGQNYEVLRGFHFKKLLKIPKFSNLLNAKIISIEVNH